MGGTDTESCGPATTGPSPNAPNKKHVLHRNVLLPGELLNAVRNQVAVFEPQGEDSADCCLGSLHLASSSQWFFGILYPSTQRGCDRDT